MYFYNRFIENIIFAHRGASDKAIQITEILIESVKSGEEFLSKKEKISLLDSIKENSSFEDYFLSTKNNVQLILLNDFLEEIKKISHHVFNGKKILIKKQNKKNQTTFETNQFLLVLCTLRMMAFTIHSIVESPEIISVENETEENILKIKITTKCKTVNVENIKDTRIKLNSLEYLILFNITYEKLIKTSEKIGCKIIVDKKDGVLSFNLMIPLQAERAFYFPKNVYPIKKGG